MARNRVANLVGTISGTSINVASISLTSGLNVSDQANNAYAQANLAYGQANAAYSQANAAFTQANLGYTQANTATTNASNAHNQANSAYGQANAAYAQANAAYGQANTGYNAANTAQTTAQNAYGQANTATTNAGNAYTQANNAYSQANNAYGQANLAYTQANTAFTAANNSNLKSGGVISGTLNVTNDIIVGGNVYLQGNTTFINVATYQINDSLMYIAANNILTDSVDIGFVGAKNTSGTFSHTGFARDATDGKYKLFDNLPDSGHVGNVIDFANSTIATLVANVEANTLTLGGNTVATQANLTLAHNQANNAYTAANNRVLKSGDTMTGNLTFSGTGLRIIADMSNATEANRLFFQTSTTNGSTRLGVIPNGTQTASAVDVFNNSDPTNASFTRLRTSSTESQVQAAITGTGTYLPMTFYTGGGERVRLDTSGVLSMGTGVGQRMNWYLSGNTKYGIAIAAGDYRNYTPDGNAFTLGHMSTTDGTTYTERIRMDASGNLGIGTTSPGTRLEVRNDTTNLARVRVTSSATTAGNYRGYEFHNGSIFKGGLLQDQSTDEISIFTPIGGNSFRVDTNGNLGLGVTPSASWANYKVLQIGEQGVISGFASGAGVLNTGANFYWDGSGYRYLTTNSASLYQQNAGAHNWRIAASGTAGNAITFTQAMTLDASGNLGVGVTSPTVRLDVAGSTNVTSRARFEKTGTGKILQFGADRDTTAVPYIGSESNHDFSFITNNTERARIDSSGNLGIGTTSPGERLTIQGGARATTGIVASFGGLASSPSPTKIHLSDNWGWNWTIGGNSSGNFVFNSGEYGTTAGTTRLTIDSSGNLGIGATSPAARVDIRGSGAQTLYFVSTTGSNQTNVIASLFNNGAAYSNLALDGNTLLFRSGASATEAARIDASGNLGLGVTPGAWNTSYKAFQNGQSSFMSRATGDDLYINANAIFESGGWKYITSNFSSRYELGSGNHLWFTAGSGTAGNTITFTQAMTLDASGNLQVNTGNIYTATTSGIFFSGAIGSFTNGIYGIGSNNVAINANGSERARITSAGVFNIGTTAGNTDDGNLVVAGNVGTGQGAANTVAQINIWETSSGNKSGLWFGAKTNEAAGVIGSRRADGAITFQTYSGSSWGERARITGGGNFGIGDTNPGAAKSSGGTTYTNIFSVDATGFTNCAYFKYANNGAMVVLNNTYNTSTRYYLSFDNGTTRAGDVTYNGSVMTYGGTSDYRLKENIAPILNGIERVKQLNPVTFTWKTNGNSSEGFIAHEVQNVVPMAVVGDKDAVNSEGNPIYQQIDPRHLVATLTSALKEAIAKIEILESEVAALKNK